MLIPNPQSPDEPLSNCEGHPGIAHHQLAKCFSGNVFFLHFHKEQFQLQTETKEGKTICVSHTCLLHSASNLVAKDPKGAPSFMHVHEGLVPGLDFANHSNIPQCW